MKSRITKLAAAAVIILAVAFGITYFAPSIDGASVAFADIVEKINDVRYVVFKQQIEVKEDGGRMENATIMIADSGIWRMEFPSDYTTLLDLNTGRQLDLNPQKKQATLMHMIGREQPERRFNYLEYLKMVPEMFKFGSFEQLDGKRTELFIHEEPYERTSVWVDVESKLPVKFETITTRNPDESIIAPKMTLSVRDFGADSNEAWTSSIGGSQGITETMMIVRTDFEWYTELDESLFSFEVPEGYTLEERQTDSSEPSEKQLIEALAFWTEMTDGFFPTAINDLGEQDKVKELLVAKYDRDGDPKEEFEDAYKKMNRILQAVYFVQERKVEGSWGYAGDGVKLGESDVPICWWKQKDSDTYRVIYGDLSIADSNDIPQLEN